MIFARLTVALLLCTLIVAEFGTPAAQACGADSDCAVGERHYRIHLPPLASDGRRIGAIVFAHGYKGSAVGTMRNKSLRRLADRLGVALVAVKSAGDDWSIPGAPSLGAVEGVDELAYFDAVRADLLERFPVDPERMMVTGFSAGGMMVWTLACHRSGDYAGFAPLAGTFWRPIPVECEPPVASIIHIHGTADKIVPLDGRVVQDGRQGSIHDVLAMYTAFGEFGAGKREPIGELVCEHRGSGEAVGLRFCTFAGGHSFKSDYLRQAWAMFVADGVL
ncbi:MAG: PHB depolymerase family esterase [Pseudomonadota bacterium]